jgi:hypothetical protein
LLDSRRRARFTAVKSDARSCGGGRIRRRRALRRPLSSAPLSGSGGGLEGASAHSSFLPCPRAQPGFGRGRRSAGEVPRRRTGWPAREGAVELESASAGRAPRSIHLEAAAGEGRVVEAELPGVAPRLRESSPAAANQACRRESSPPPTKSTAGKEAAGSSQAAGKSTRGRGARPPPAPHPTPPRPEGSAAPRRRGGCGGGRGTRTEGSGWNCADEERREKPPVSPRMRLPPSPSAKSRSRCSDRWTMNSVTSFFILQIQ